MLKLFIKFASSIIKLAAIFLIVLFNTAACNNDGVIVLDDYIVQEETDLCPEGWHRVLPIKTDDITTKYLDSIFSRANNLISTNFVIDSLCLHYVINSNEELKKINSYSFEVDIDFSKYTIIGSRIINAVPVPFISKTLHYNMSLLRYYYKISFDGRNNSTFAVVTYEYFWNVYPKLDSNYKITFETAFVNIIEE